MGTNADYEYTSGRTGRETACAHDTSKTIGNVTNIGQITTNIDDVKQKLKTHPLTIAVDAGGSVFQFYSSGVVGSTEAGDDGSDDTAPKPDPQPDPQSDPQPDPVD